VRTSASTALALRQREIRSDTYGSERICSPPGEVTVNLGDWRVRVAAYVEAAKPSSITSTEDLMMKGVDEASDGLSACHVRIGVDERIFI
jgi:hypothetical protein